MLQCEVKKNTRPFSICILVEQSNRFSEEYNWLKIIWNTQIVTSNNSERNSYSNTAVLVRCITINNCKWTIQFTYNTDLQNNETYKLFLTLSDCQAAWILLEINLL